MSISYTRLKTESKRYDLCFVGSLDWQGREKSLSIPKHVLIFLHSSIFYSFQIHRTSSLFKILLDGLPRLLHGPINVWNCFMAYIERIGLSESLTELYCKEIMNTQLSNPINHSMDSCRHQEKKSNIMEMKLKLALILHNLNMNKFYSYFIMSNASKL